MKKNFLENLNEKMSTKIVVLIVVISLVLGYAMFEYKTLRDSLTSSEQNIELIKEDFSQRLTNLENSFEVAASENITLAEALQLERERNEKIKDDLEDISDVVGDLEKLKDIDPELLQKYSKVYFLNEHYEPSDLEKLSSKYVYNGDKTIQIHGEVEPFLEDLIDDARDDGVDISIASGYRSFGEQSGLKSSYVFTYGAGTANQFSADQGYSEHQLGTAVDFTTDNIGGGFGGFQNTEAYEWLNKNAYKYGFVLSYPEGNAYYQFEPWHWRFVGESLAKKLYKDDVHFYDYDQRRIDEYLIKIFD